MKKQPDKGHSSIGASSMYRWSVCPGSVKMSEGLHAPTSRYAAEGTCAHSLADACLAHSLDADTYLDHKRTAEGHEFTVDSEMAEGVQLYLDTVRGDFDKESGDQLFSEQKFDLSTVYPGLWGTNDALIWKPQSRTLKVYDFKYGAGIPVEVKRNKQLMYYALGAVMTLKLPVNTVEIHIVQPRCPHPDGPVRKEIMSAIDLLDFRSDLAMSAAATTKDGAPLKAGNHCRFCPAAGICPENAKKAHEAAALVFENVAPVTPENPKGIDYAKLGEALRLVPIVKAWAAAVDELAYAEAESGKTIPGYKLVEKRPTRQWKDIADAEQQLKKLGLGETQMYPEPVLKSPAQIEKVLGKKQFGKIESDLVEKKSSGHALAPDTDKRPAVTKQSAADAFASA